jgi:hypothetical protein
MAAYFLATGSAICSKIAVNYIWYRLIASIDVCGESDMLKVEVTYPLFVPARRVSQHTERDVTGPRLVESCDVPMYAVRPRCSIQSKSLWLQSSSAGNTSCGKEPSLLCLHEELTSESSYLRLATLSRSKCTTRSSCSHATSCSSSCLCLVCLTTWGKTDLAVSGGVACICSTFSLCITLSLFPFVLWSSCLRFFVVWAGSKLDDAT